MTTFNNGIGPYKMQISRMTVDKLGVRLYDRVSAVVAELIANAYDADAETVKVNVPLNTLLARLNSTTHEIEEFEHVIEVKDDGHGMTPSDVNEHFLWVGKDRRKDVKLGSRSRNKNRNVMGRKGIGKLAPFGICKIIEVISAGGNPTEKGYIVSHFKMDYDQILEHSDEPIEIERGELDRTYMKATGTTIRLINFLPKRVPNRETFHRQLAVRFGIQKQDFNIQVTDSRNPVENKPFMIGSYDIPLMEETRIDLVDLPVELDDGQTLPVTGWMGLAKNAYKNEEMAGVRIYARGKIVATTRDFEKPAGYTGEFTLRSYLVGEVHADWIDEDDGEDLITTDRQDILWESDYGRALRKWGSDRIKAIGAASRQPRRERVEMLFLKASDLDNRARDYFADSEVSSMAISLGKQIGRLASEDELNDGDYVESLTTVILTVAPHMALIEALKEFRSKALGLNGGIDKLLDLFSKTRIAEMASYAQIASERVEVIRRLTELIHDDPEESDLQSILADAPWLIEPTWTPITINQSLKQFVRGFENYYHKKFQEEVILAIDHHRKRPDFILANMSQKLHIVEIKAVGHTFKNADWDRLHNYLDAFENFFSSHPELEQKFEGEWVIDLICDSVNITDRDMVRAYEWWKNKEKIIQISWEDFLTRATLANEQFLDVQDRVRGEADRLSGEHEGS